MASSGLRHTLLTLVAALVGLVALPVLSFFVLSIGPAARVVYYDYLPLEALIVASSSAALGVSLALDQARRLRGMQRGLLWQQLQWLGFAALTTQLTLAQIRGFPAAASPARRDAWARSRIPMYPALARVVTAIPQLHRDVGRIVVIAPTSGYQHRAAREMNGDDMHFALDIHGERGRGTLYVDCTLDDYLIYDWRSARWVFDGHETRIPPPSAAGNSAAP